MTEDSKAGWPWVLTLTLLAYALAGWLATRIAFAPSYAAPLYPSAGVAFAAAWVYARPALAGAALGGFAVNVGLSAARGQFDVSALGTPALIGQSARSAAASSIVAALTME